MTGRRSFLGGIGAFGAAAFAGCSGRGGSRLCAERVPYGDTVGDRLWMWGHHRDSFKALKGTDEQYNLPYDTRIDMADACRAMDVPGCFVVRWTNNPTTAELPEYMRQFSSMRRIGFSITDSAKETFDEKVRLGFSYADLMPNLTTFVMDDFFSYYKENARHVGKLNALRDDLSARGMRLGVVLYADHNGLRPEYRQVLDVCDEVTFWFWHGKNTGGIESEVSRLRDLVGGGKQVLLGQYMYDFGGKKPMPGVVMGRQLAQTSRLLAAKAIDGVIFHCTPLVDMDLDAVRVSREWIRENRDRRWGF